jgi:gliding motility-associated-like protein
MKTMAVLPSIRLLCHGYCAAIGRATVGDVLDCDVIDNCFSSDYPTGSYMYQWDTSNGQIVSGNGTTAIVVDRAGIYTLYVTSNANGCTDTVSIEVLADPEVIAGIDAVVDNPDCPGDHDGMIEILQILGGSPPFTYAWSNQTSGSGLLFLSPGTYTVTVTDANGCVFVESYTLPVPVAINPGIGADLLYNYGETLTINLTVTDPGTVAEITWGGVAPACPGCFTNSFLADISGFVYVTVIDENGCEARDTLELEVEKNRNIYIPNVFSPNGDNINDIFKIQGALLGTVEYLVFDRWGDVVFEQAPTDANTQQGWDGTRNGKQLNPGVYIYTAMLIHRDGFEEVVSGDVTLVR